MIIAIMQPYFFPYIGYFQLMAAVDAFVFLDDVQYVDRSWMNRNRIRRDGRSVWLSMPVRKGARTALINQRCYVLDEAGDAVARNVFDTYMAAPNFEAGSTLVSELLRYGRNNVAEFNAHLLREIAGQLGVVPTLALSSEIRGSDRLAGQAGILDICQRMSATRYINAIGGVDLYDDAVFATAGVELRFLRTRVPPVVLADGSAEHLSIIDGLMHDGVAGCTALLQSYELLAPATARACRLEAMGG